MAPVPPHISKLEPLKISSSQLCACARTEWAFAPLIQKAAFGVFSTGSPIHPTSPAPPPPPPVSSSLAFHRLFTVRSPMDRESIDSTVGKGDYVSGWTPPPFQETPNPDQR